MKLRRRLQFLAFVVVIGLSATAAFAESIVVRGAGSYSTGRPAGAKGPPESIYATAAVHGKMPTNDWWSSLAWMPFSERQYPHPLAVQAETGGMRIYYPGNRITATRDAIFGFMSAGTGDDLLLGHSEQHEFPDARVDGFSDWFVTAAFQADSRRLTVSYGHGCPFVFARLDGGVPRLTFAKPPEIWFGDAQSATLGVTVNGKHYGLFGPSAATWTGIGSRVMTCESHKGYFTVAILPDRKAETLGLFGKYAHAHIVDTQIAWHYDAKSSTVTTRYGLSTVSHEGAAKGSLLALYPHQWKHTEAELLEQGYNSVRGEMKLLEGTSFETKLRFSGVLPGLPNVGGCDERRMADLLRSEVHAATPAMKDTYWEGKWLGRTATLIPVAEEYGQQEVADALRTRLRTRLEQWLTATDEQGQPKPTALFCYDDRWGTLIGYPASYGSDVELNDHHFHYGYFIRAAAEIARSDPQWARRWADMVELLIRDVACPDRSDRMFPFLRNFDPYAGHSWASGHAKFGDGNNNESSSEAMNAWYGMILWGEFAGNREIRDLGVFLYTTEMTAIHEYWFDVHDTNHPATYSPSVVTMIWGGKGANGTWFSANPEMVHGINWLPIHGGSLYLGHFPEYVEKNYAALREENSNQPWDAWADLIWMYRALSDPQDALRQFEAGKDSLPLEAGNSLANTYHWIGALGKLGSVQPRVTADCALHAVFQQDRTRHYVTYWRDAEPGVVRFSDGVELPCDQAGFHRADRTVE